MSRALPRGAETDTTRTTGSVNDGQSSKVLACTMLCSYNRERWVGENNAKMHALSAEP